MLLSNVNRRKAGRFVPVVLAGLILAACSTQGPQTPAVNVQAPATGTSAYYLQQMQQSSDDSKTDWQLLAIRALMAEGKYPDAGKQLQTLPQKITATQQQELNLLKAQYAVATHNSAAALPLLKSTDVSGLSADQKTRYYATTIAATSNQPTLETVRAYIALQPLLQGDAAQKNIDATWQTLRKFPQQQTNNFVFNANENILQGWLDLLGVYYHSNGDQNALKAGVKDWQTRYPDNPASKQLPAGLLQSMNMTPASTSTIALLLPLTGPAAVFSQAIEKGFEDARNGVINQVTTAATTAPAQSGSTTQAVGTASANGEQGAVTPPATTTVTGSANAPISATSPADPNVVVSPSATSVPGSTSGVTADSATPATAAAPVQAETAPASSNAQIKVYDTNAQPVAQLIQQAQNDGATLVVGPLLKEDVSTVAGLSTPLNILALNEPGSLQNHPNMCYFALSPENEARDAARHIWEQNKRMPLLLVPSNNYGTRVANAFTLEWQKLGGSVVEEQTFGSVADLKQRINGSSGIPMSGTPVVVQAPSTATSGAISVAGLTFNAPQQPAPVTDTPASGKVDSVYIVASQAELSLIKPMITMSTGSRSNIALYASSRSSQAGSGPDFRLEMDGLQFSDIPLLSGANPALMQQAVKNFNNDYSLTRLYAMGIDAWTLANHFSQLRQQPGYQVNGDTGILSASQNCVINRTLSWNQYSQGQIVPVH